VQWLQHAEYLLADAAGLESTIPQRREIALEVVGIA
jgi:hypothetical protein